MSVTSGTKSESGLGETIRVVIHALLIALVIRTFLFQPFNIPSGSMKATLLVGDYLFVSKYSYGYSHYSIPLSPPLFSGRIFGSEPARGDVVVFRLPKDDSTDYIKRVIGLPGDRIQMKDGLLYINDKPVVRERLSDFIGEDPCGSDATARVKRWKETLPNGVSYESLDCVDNGFYDNTNVYTVPPGHFFMMGDNRDNSTDSRVLSAVGYVPFENLDRPRPDDFLLHCRGRTRLDVLALADRGALELHILNRAMNDETPDIQTPSASGEASPQPDAGARACGGEEEAQQGQRQGGAAAAIEARIGHKFADPALLATAFTHVSALKSARKRGDSYQRLEFLGDHVLGLIVSDMLYRAFPNADEGELSKRLADLVRKESCADVAKSLGLLDDIKLGAVGAGAGARLAQIRARRHLRSGDRRGVSRRRLWCGGAIRRAQLDRADAQAAAAAARSQDRAAGMGAGQGPADAGLSRGRTHRAASRSAVPRRGGFAGTGAGRRRRRQQARRRKGRGLRDDRARRRRRRQQ